MVKTLNDTDMVTSRRAALKSFAAKAGLTAAVVAGGAMAAARPAAASDRHSQTDNDTGRNSDAPNQTDND